MLANFIKGHLHKLRLEMAEMVGAPMLEFYTRQWSHYIAASKTVSNVFDSLQAEWLKTEMALPNGYSDLYSTMIQLWYQYLFRPMSTRNMQAVADMVKQERKGVVVDKHAIQGLLPAYFELKPEKVAGVYSPYRDNMGVYLHYFERPYINASAQYVDSILQPLYNAASIGLYICKASNLLDLEEARGKLILLPESHSFLCCHLTDRFIGCREREINAEAKRIIFLGQHDDKLYATYNLLGRLRSPHKLKTLCSTLAVYIKQDIIESSPAATDTSIINSTSTTTTAAAAAAATVSSSLSSSHSKGEAVVVTANSHLDYTNNFIDNMVDRFECYQRILSECFGDNKQIESAIYESLGESDPIRLLAEYYGFALRADNSKVRQAEATSNDPETMVIDRIKHTLPIYRLSKNKSEFFKYYSLDLSRRLLDEQTVSLELERSIVSMITITSYMEFAVRFRDMLVDITTSQDISRDFSRSLSDDKNASWAGIPLQSVNIKVLKTDSWPSLNSLEGSAWTTPPAQIQRICTLFLESYNRRHGTNSAHKILNPGMAKSNRRLNWIWAYSKCTVQFYFPHSTGTAQRTGYTFILNTYQLAILTLFTEPSGQGTGYDTPDGPWFTASCIQTATGIEKEVVDSELLLFTKARILLQVARAADSSVSESLVYRLNNKFQSRKMRIDISKIKKLQRAKEEAKIAQYLIDDRRQYMKADIVKTMKRDKSKMHRDLFDAVSKARQGFYVVDMKEFKTAIEDLIEKEYVKRDEKNKQKYIYCS
ncbi:ubiquitin ligase (cullin) of SCF [Coemansia sp. Benny D115]|nr:ubiquitin ligase (cullin) of SCF [Coemansia sp. Benny D115]